ncbi:serine protease 53-like [Uranotaenia lowii]|uniref:serine protease 53-like n=1 Tax=Uranotaenia lowii TaxID=190385 RepID=UPI002478DDEA|nr:serine protease 53-like [Uranotaenia lowii]
MKFIPLMCVWLGFAFAFDDNDEFSSNNALYRCGIPKPFGEQYIHRGWVAELGQWPWHVAMFHEEKGSWEYKCGGTLIDQRHVLTAAHCVVLPNGKPMDAGRIRLEFGQHELYRYPDQVQARNISEVHVHQEYSRNRNDIALLVLDKAVRYSEFVIPICLEDARRGLQGDLVGDRGWVPGWGGHENGSTSLTLFTARMPVVSNTDCIESDPNLFGRFITDAVYCAGDRNKTSVCLGDSGGGMYFNTGDHYELRGIVSFSGKTPEGSCDVDKFAVFTNVAHFYPWISRLTRNEIELYDNVPRSISEQKCIEYAKLAEKRNNGVCYNSRSPHTVSVLYNDRIVSTGVLISEKFIITSFNHMYRNYKRIQRSSTLPEGLTAQYIQIRVGHDLFLTAKGMYRHPSFVNIFRAVDLFLIELMETVTLSRQLIPACLANRATENLYGNLLRTGYAGSQFAQFFESSENRIMSFKECIDTMDRNTLLAVPPFQLCIELLEPQDEPDSQEAEDGYSGLGSLLQTVNSRSCMSTILGIENQQHDKPTGSLVVYSRIAAVVDWIEDIVWGNRSDWAVNDKTVIRATSPQPETERDTTEMVQGTTYFETTLPDSDDSELEHSTNLYDNFTLTSGAKSFSHFNVLVQTLTMLLIAFICL